MHLKNRFCQIHADHCILCHGCRPFRSVASTPLTWHIAMPIGEGGNHPIYFHVVFTLPAEIADIAFHNKALIYDLLFKAASETMLTIAADPRHLGARIGI